MGCELGLRNSEARGLRVLNVDPVRRRVTIERQIVEVPRDLRTPGAPRWVEALTKGKLTRELPISHNLAELLRRYLALLKDAGHPPNGFLFAGRKPGAPVSMPCPNDMVARWQRAAGILDGRGRPRIVYHGLRHTCASVLICRGVPLFKVSRFLGHSSVSVTERVYAHLLNPNELEELAHVFDGEPWARAANRAGNQHEAEAA
jgi:integrase